MSNIAVRVEHLNKSFKLPHERRNSVKSLFINIFRGFRLYEQQHVLKNISFEVKEGEFFAILGRNGSGKSTLLKLLAGIYTPDKGTVQINGKLTPFIELGVGFNPELTGRENVYLNGALLGFNRKEVDSMYKDIVNFAELERFMDQKLKNYSSGMQVRLAFSIAIRAKSNILLLDEVLAVGDLDFQKKCYDYFVNIKKRKQTVVLVTHDMSIVRRFCDRCILIHDGELISEGKPEKIAEKYENINLRAAEKRLDESNQNSENRLRDGRGGAKIIATETFDPLTKKLQNTFSPREKIGVRLKFAIETEIENPTLGFIFQDEKDSTVFATNNHIQNVKVENVKPGQEIVLETVVDNVFTDGSYTITAAIESDDFLIVYDRVKYLYTFLIGGHSLAHAAVHPTHKMLVSYKFTAKAS